MLGGIGLGELIVIGVVVFIMAGLALVVRMFVSGSAASIRSQVTAARLGSSDPTRRLATVPLQPGVATELRASAAANADEHGIWLEYSVRSEEANAEWTAKVHLEWRAGTHSQSSEQTFAIGYSADTDVDIGHYTRRDLTGLTYVPKKESSPPNTDEGCLKLASLQGLTKDTPIVVRCTITPTSKTTSWTSTLVIAT